MDQNGMPHSIHAPPSQILDPTQHLLAPLCKRQRCWWRCLDRQRAEALARRDVEMEKRLHGCGGPEGGAFLRGTRPDLGYSFTDTEFLLAVRYRLGIDVMPATACQHGSHSSSDAPGTQKTRICNQRADRKGHHAVICKVGGAPYAAQSQGCSVLHGASQRAGYHARREQVIPELRTPECQSPQLDLEGWSLRGQERLLVDFTIRHPLAARYAGCNATATAEREKQRHYQPKQGLHVHAAALDIFGRHGKGMVRLLELLADSARQRDKEFGLAPNRWLRKWRIQLSGVAARLVGRAVQRACSLGACPS